MSQRPKTAAGGKGIFATTARNIGTDGANEYPQWETAATANTHTQSAIPPLVHSDMGGANTHGRGTRWLDSRISKVICVRCAEHRKYGYVLRMLRLDLVRRPIHGVVCSVLGVSRVASMTFRWGTWSVVIAPLRYCCPYIEERIHFALLWSANAFECVDSFLTTSNHCVRSNDCVCVCVEEATTDIRSVSWLLLIHVAPNAFWLEKL